MNKALPLKVAIALAAAMFVALSPFLIMIYRTS